MVHTIWNDLYKVWIYKRIIHTGMNAYIGTESTKLCMEYTCILQEKLPLKIYKKWD